MRQAGTRGRCRNGTCQRVRGYVSSSNEGWRIGDKVMRVGGGTGKYGLEETRSKKYLLKGDKTLVKAHQERFS